MLLLLLFRAVCPFSRAKQRDADQARRKNQRHFREHQSNKLTKKVPGCRTVWLKHEIEALRWADLSPRPRHLFKVNLRAAGSHKQHMSSRFPACTGAAVWVGLIILSCPIIDALGLDRGGRAAICRGSIEGEIRGAGGRLFGGQSGGAPSESLSLLQGRPEGNRRRF